MPDATRPFLTPGYPLLPLLTVVVYVALFVIIAVTQPELALGGAALIVLLAMAGWAWNRYDLGRTGTV